MENANTVFLDLAIIIASAKVLGMLVRKIRIPQVVGEILAGLIIGPSVLGIVDSNDFLVTMAQIGVVLLMFSAGLETDLKKLAQSGFVATLIAMFGVAIPMAGGTFLYMAYYGISFGDAEVINAVLIGCIMTATSVGITVESLKEMGFLQGKVGTTILSAAIIDDVIGIVVLTFVLGFKDKSISPLTTVWHTLLFFAWVFLFGYVCYRIFKWYDAKHPHTRRIPIAGLALCLFMAYTAPKFFGIADITGAFAAGIILCNVRDSKYIAEKMDINSYMLFGPVFFASIGIKTTIKGSEILPLLGFSLLFVLVAMATKIIGCGFISKICRFSWSDSLKIGCGMMTRGEVALIISQMGLTMGLIEPKFFTSVILLILCSSILTPIILKLLYAKFPEQIDVSIAGSESALVPVAVETMPTVSSEGNHSV